MFNFGIRTDGASEAVLSYREFGKRGLRKKLVMIFLVLNEFMHGKWKVLCYRADLIIFVNMQATG